MLQFRYLTVCAPACAEVRGQVPCQASTRSIFPPGAFGLQSLSVGFRAVLPLPGSSAEARDTATGPHQRQTARLAVRVLQIAVLFSQRRCALRLFQGNKRGWTLTWPCSFPSLGRLALLRESSLSHPSINTSLVQTVTAERGLWINYYRDPHSGVKNFLELLSEKSKFAFK